MKNPREEQGQMTQIRESRSVLLFFFLSPPLSIESGCCCFHFVFIFIPILPPQHFKEKARKRACPPSWSTEKESPFDVLGLLVQVQDPCWFLLKDCPGRILRGMPQTLTLPKSFQLLLFLKTLKGYKLSSSGLATGFFVARSRWLREKAGIG